MPGAIIGVLSTTLVALAFGMIQYNGLVSMPPSLEPVFLKLDILGALNISMITIVMSFYL